MVRALNQYGLRVVKNDVDPEIHKTKDALQLRETCQQFESILWAKLWKDMRNNARSISGEEKERPWGQLEDLSLEMASEDLVERSGGAGMWKMLYDSMIAKVAADVDARETREADKAAEAEYHKMTTEAPPQPFEAQA